MATEHTCETCGFSSLYKSAFDKHFGSKRHKRCEEGTDYKQFKHVCEACMYGTNSSKLMASHCRTKRHKAMQGKTDYHCHCGEYFHSQRAKSFHVKSCAKSVPEPSQPTEQSATQPQPNPEQPTHHQPQQPSSDSVLLLQMFQTMMDKNDKVMANQTKLIEAISNGNLANNTTNNNTTNNTDNSTNTQNNTMNLNLFLDEHCKNAMNLTDFFDKLKVFQSDLPDVLRVNNPKAISNILERELGKLSITERPIHCTDVKRKKMFVKNDDKWTSEQGTDKIDQVIRSTCAHQFNAWNKRLQNTDREDRAEKHYDETAEIGAIVGKHTTVWGDPGNRLMQETHNGICNMVYLSKDDARGVVDENAAIDPNPPTTT